jgi:hypothetical protein
MSDSSVTFSIPAITDPKVAPGNLVRALASLLLDRARREIADQHKQQKMVVKK